MKPNDNPIVLLVDDEQQILVALADLLEDRYRILSSTSPTEALRLLAAEPDVSVIVSDQRMPEMTGEVFLARARELSDAQAILITGYADLGAVTAALNKGGIVGYVAKPWEPGPLRGVVATAAEQHRLRRALKQEHALLRGLMEHVPLAIAFKDREGRFVELNNAKAAELKLAVEACIGRTEAELTGVEPSAAERQALLERRPKQLITEPSEKIGPVWRQADFVPILDPAGQVEFLVVTERDITERVEAEARLRQSEKLRALGAMASGVAHDFNNLLTVLTGSLELAGRRLGDQEALRRHLANALAAAGRGAVLTQRLLGFSRQTEGRAAVVDVGALLYAMRDFLAPTLGTLVSVEWRLDADLWPAKLEPDQLELVMLNLAINARDAMPNGGSIVIQARNVTLDADSSPPGLAAGEYVCLSVTDTGEGMSPEVLERVLEPFFTTKPVGEGTGLGLPLAYGFARRSGGALEIDSKPGCGACIRLHLPRSLAAAPGQEEAPRQEQPAAANGPKRRILVVDDEPDVRAVTASLLRSLGHDVVEAGDGWTGLQLLASPPGGIDAAVVDITMPKMNGLEFLRKARARCASMPLVLVTGNSPEGVPPEVPVVRKPFSADSLRAGLAEASCERAKAG